MSHHTYRRSDLEPLTGGIRALDSISCSEIRRAGEAFSLYAVADDVPPPLRRYYAKVGKYLMGTATRLGKNLRSAKSQGCNLAMRINSSLDSLKLTEDDLNRLRHVNNRLLELEKSLKQMADGMRERLEGLDPSGVEWETWDGTDIELCVDISPNPECPTSSFSEWQEAGFLSLKPICARISQRWKPDTREEKESRWLDDGQNHSDMGECEGHPLQHFHQSYLFHELCDHAGVGIWGMLHLRTLWIEIIPHRRGEFTI